MPFDERPFLVFWELSRACLLRCAHCRAVAQLERHPGELSTDEGRRLIDALVDLGRPRVILTGGDPLMRPDFFDLVDYAVRQGLSVSVTPSVTPKVTEDVIRKAKAAGIARWAVSLDGATADVHDGFRGVPGTFDRALRLLGWLKAYGLPAQVNTTVTRRNVHQLEAIAERIADYDIVLWVVFFLVPTGRARMEEMLDARETEAVFARLYALDQTMPYAIKTTEAHHYRRYVLQQKARELGRPASTLSFQAFAQRKRAGQGAVDDGIGRAPDGLRDGAGVVFISHIGDVFPSGFLPVKAGNVREAPLGEIYRRSPVFRALRNPDGFGGKCGVCDFRHICGGSRARAYAVSGDMLAAEPTCAYIPPAWTRRIAEQKAGGAR